MICRRWSWCLAALVLSAGNGRAADAQTRPEEERVRRERAAEYLKQALAAAEAKDPVADGLWRNIAVAQAALGQTKEALESVERVKGEGRTDALIEVAHMLLEGGDRVDAKATMDRANDEQKKIANKIDRLGPSLRIVDVQLALGDLVGAKAMAESNDWPIARMSLLLRIAASQWKAGDKAGAGENYATCAKLISEEPELKGLKGQIELDRAKAGDIDGARQGMAAVAEPHKAFLLASIGAAELKKGDKVAAKADCDAARRDMPSLNSGATSDDKLETAGFLEDLCEVYAGLGEEKVVEELRREAQKLLVEARALVGKEGGVFEVYKLMDVASGQRKLHDMGGAKETCNAVVTLLEKSSDENTGYAESLWKAATRVAPVDPALARDLVAKALVAAPPLDKNYAGVQDHWPETGASVVAEGIVQAEGAKADLVWIEKLKTQRAKAHAYAEAAAAMVEEGGDKAE